MSEKKIQFGNNKLCDFYKSSSYQYTKRPEINSFIVKLTLDDLGRNVVRRTTECRGHAALSAIFRFIFNK